MAASSYQSERKFNRKEYIGALVYYNYSNGVCVCVCVSRWSILSSFDSS